MQRAQSVVHRGHMCGQARGASCRDMVRMHARTIVLRCGHRLVQRDVAGPTVLATCPTAACVSRARLRGNARTRCAHPGKQDATTRQSSRATPMAPAIRRSSGPAHRSSSASERAGKRRPMHRGRVHGGKDALPRRQGRTCADDLTAFEATATCTGTTPQCDPSSGMCIALAIDAYEVTRAQYAAFLAAQNKGAQPAACSTNVFDPDAACMAGTEVCKDSCESHPQVCVDWCDAYAYCAWKGHACAEDRRRSDFLRSVRRSGQKRVDERVLGGGQLAYPYGDTQLNAPCNGKSRAKAAPSLAVRSRIANPP